MKPAVLVLTSTYPRWPNDIEPGFVQELCKRLAHKYTVHVVTSHYSGSQCEEIMEGVHVHRFRYAPATLERLVYPGGMLTNVRLKRWTILLLPFFFLAQLYATWRVARRPDIKLVHAHWVIPQGLAVLLLRPFLARKPLLVTSHGADIYGLRGKFFTWLRAKVWDVADAVTVVSNAMAQEASGDVEPGKLSVAPMGVDLEATFVCREPIAPRANIIFVGRLVEKKGVDVLLAGFAQVLDRYPGLRLTIVGDGPLRASLVEQAVDLSISTDVDFVGAVPNTEIPQWLNRHAIAVVPSVVASGGDQEGLGLVSVEAMGCGCSVLASDLPAIRDVVRDGDNGLTFQPGNASALADGLARLLGDQQLREDLAVAGCKGARDEFDWSIATANYLDIYARLL